MTRQPGVKAKYAGHCDRCDEPIKRGAQVILKTVAGLPVMLHPRCASGQEDGGATFTPKVAKTKQTKMFVSGFCNRNNPPDSHARCKVVAGELLCTCECHDDAPTWDLPVDAILTLNTSSTPDTIKPGLHFDMPEVDYHTHQGSLSTSMAKQLLPPGCPAKFKANLGTPFIKKDFDWGNVVHRLVLGKGNEIAVLVDEDGVPFDSRRTNAYKAAEKAAREANQVPILAKDFEPAQAAANSVLQDPVASQLFDVPGQAEVSAVWMDEETGIMRRARFDFLPDVVKDRRMQVPDLKTAESSEPEAFGRKAADFGYAMQAAAYVDALIALELDPDPLFWFVAVEKEAPYIVTAMYADDDVLQIGRYLNRKALRIYADCLATDVWPTYQPEPSALPLPNWYTFNHQEAFQS